MAICVSGDPLRLQCLHNPFITFNFAATRMSVPHSSLKWSQLLIPQVDRIFGGGNASKEPGGVSLPASRAADVRTGSITAEAGPSRNRLDSRRALLTVRAHHEPTGRRTDADGPEVFQMTGFVIIYFV